MWLLFTEGSITFIHTKSTCTGTSHIASHIQSNWSSSSMLVWTTLSSSSPPNTWTKWNTWANTLWKDKKYWSAQWMHVLILDHMSASDSHAAWQVLVKLSLPTSDSVPCYIIRCLGATTAHLDDSRSVLSARFLIKEYNYCSSKLYLWSAMARAATL